MSEALTYYDEVTGRLHPQPIESPFGGSRNGSHNFQQLRFVVITHSTCAAEYGPALTEAGLKRLWDRARLEWYPWGAFRIAAGSDPATCRCWHHPILEIWTIVNR